MKNYILLGLALLSANLSFAQNNRSKAEVFIQIQDRGAFTVSLDNESIRSAKGRFRFFEVYTVSPVLSITQGDKRVYSQQLNVKGNERVIFTYDLFQGLKTYKILPIYKNGQYALDDFDQEVTEVLPPPTDDSPAYFQELQLAVRKASFDDAKMDLILNGLNHNLSSTQIIALLKLMNDDDKKLRIAKSAYHAIIDPQNSFRLGEGLTLLGRKNEFADFLKIKPIGRPKTTIRTAVFDQLKEQVRRESFDDNRTKLIQNSLKDAFIDTDQLQILLKLYSFEDPKVGLAKLLYFQIADQQNYHTLAVAFTFNSSKDAFFNFITNMQTKP
ncbi:MAG: DUF4476 domain-containing protein [Bacteroidota bacterium]